MICSVCNQEFDRSLIRHLHRDQSQPHVCSPCARRTYRWGALQNMYLTREEAVYVKDLNHYCTRQYAEENGFVECPVCHKWFFNSESFTHSEALNTDCCENCASAYSMPTHMTGYHESHGSAPIFYPERTNNGRSITDTRRADVHMGFELEMDRGTCGSRDEAIRDIFSHDVGMLFHTESDCSVSGFESISSPATMGYYNSIKPNLTNMYNSLTRHGLRATDNCGCHVHIDRTFFDGVENYETKLQLVVYKFRDYLQNIAHRTSHSSHWAAMCRPGEENGRYCAVNLCNSNTVEIRLWGGARSLDELYTFLYHTWAIATVAKTKSTAEINTMSLSEFKSYVESAKNVS